MNSGCYQKKEKLRRKKTKTKNKKQKHTDKISTWDYVKVNKKRVVEYGFFYSEIQPYFVAFLR